MRAIPDEPFPEARWPYPAVVSGDGQWLALVATPAPRDGRPRVAVYRKGDLSPWHVVELDHYVEVFTFHPILPLLAIGTERGDEWERNGELVLFEPEPRRRTSLRFPGEGVTALRWIDERRLEVTLAEPNRCYDDPGDISTRCVAERDEWLGLEDLEGGGLTFGPRVAVEQEDVFRQPAADRPGDRLAAWAAEAGRPWGHRDAVMAVEGLRDGRMLVAHLSSSLLACRSASGDLLWSVPVPEDTFHRSGGEVYVAPDGHTAWVTVLVGDSADRKTLLQRIDLADGTVLAERRVDFPATLVDRADGAWAARDSRDLFPTARWAPYETPVFTPTGRQLDTVALGECDSSYRGFRVRRSPHLLFLQGIGERLFVQGYSSEPCPEKWVVRVAPEGIEPLFPLRWGTCPTGPIGGGPGVFVEDGLGQAIVHVCTTLDGTYLLRRAFPEGEVVWTYRVDATVVGVDAHGGLLHVTTGERELLTLRQEDGEVLRRRPTAVGPHVFLPRCMSVAPNGEVLIGTAEGRIVVCGQEARDPDVHPAAG
ncbi:hypothetical protein [Streptomyces sp. NPDC046261]|uniref:hypothetical protein n=1 Tax=Streptomyces sp. NPDC046261 TaxID=3157200 RepID=UPI0033FA996D